MTVATRSAQSSDPPADVAGRIVISMSAPADPSSLTVVRQALGGAARALGLTAGIVADLRLALSETCSAAIRRTAGEGRIDVEAHADASVLKVVVRDAAPQALPGDGELPLPLVAAITDAVELTHLPGGGTEVTMTFRVPPAG